MTIREKMTGLLEKIEKGFYKYEDLPLVTDKIIELIKEEVEKCLPDEQKIIEITGTENDVMMAVKNSKINYSYGFNDCIEKIENKIKGGNNESLWL